MPSLVSSVCASPFVSKNNTLPRANAVPSSTPSRPALERYVTRKEVCAALNLHHDSLRRWALQGKLVPVVFGGRWLRYRVSDVEELIRATRYSRKRPGPKPRNLRQSKANP
jgi:hypothetical protein